jgi:hypothetical protein
MGGEGWHGGGREGGPEEADAGVDDAAAAPDPQRARARARSNVRRPR